MIRAITLLYDIRPNPFGTRNIIVRNNYKPVPDRILSVLKVSGTEKEISQLNILFGFVTK